MKRVWAHLPPGHLVGTLLFLALIVFGCKAAPRMTRSDFRRYYTAGAAVLEGRDIYAARGRLQFKYFPVFALCMAPLAVLSIGVAAWVWYLIVVASYAALLAVAARWAGPAPPGQVRYRLWVVVAALLVTARFFVSNARLGQINLPVAALAVLGAWCVFHGRPRLGGMLTAWAAVLKFMPVVLIVWYAWQRRWLAAAYGLLGIFVGSFVLPALVWGWEGNLELLGGYIGRRSKMVTSVPQHDAPGQSVPALLNRLLRPVRASSLHEDEVFQVNLAALSRSQVNRIAAACVVVLVVGVGWWTRRPVPDGAGRETGAAVALVLLLMLLISPEARRAHFITLALPGAVVGGTILWQRRGRAGLLTLLGVAGVLILGTSSGLVGDLASSRAEAYGCVLVATLLLGFAVLLGEREGARGG